MRAVAGAIALAVAGATYEFLPVRDPLSAEAKRMLSPAWLNAPVGVWIKQFGMPSSCEPERYTCYWADPGFVLETTVRDRDLPWDFRRTVSISLPLTNVWVVGNLEAHSTHVFPSDQVSEDVRKWPFRSSVSPKTLILEPAPVVGLFVSGVTSVELSSADIPVLVRFSEAGE